MSYPCMWYYSVAEVTHGASCTVQCASLVARVIIIVVVVNVIIMHRVSHHMHLSSHAAHHSACPKGQTANFLCRSIIQPFFVSKVSQHCPSCRVAALPKHPCINLILFFFCTSLSPKLLLCQPCPTLLMYVPVGRPSFYRFCLGSSTHATNRL